MGFIQLYALAKAANVADCPPHISCYMVGGIACLYEWSDGNPADFERLAQDFNWLAAKAVAHDSAIRQLASAMPIIPFRLGTCFSSEASMEEAIHAQETRWHSALGFVADKEEWSVKAYFTEAPAGHTNATVQALEEEIAQASPGKAFFLKKKLAQAMEQAAEEARQMAIQHLVVGAQQHSLQLKYGRMLDSKLTGVPHEMALNLACLVEKGQVDAFLQAMQVELPAVAIAVAGPWPIYSFEPY